MVYSRMRSLVVTCGLAAALLAAPVAGSACDCLSGLFGGRTTYAVPTYAPAPAYTSASVCSPCVSTVCSPCVSSVCSPCVSSVCSPCVSQTCSYVPETCYRTVYRAVPVTTYRPVSSWSLSSLFCCTPPTTTYRPVTTWVQQAYTVPYTTYRLVCSDACVSYDSCAVSVPAVPGPCCTPATSVPAISAPPPAAPAAPAAPAPGSEMTPKTFENGSQPGTEKSLKPEQEPDDQVDSTSAPVLKDPGKDRMTQRSIRQATRVQLVASPPTTAPVFSGPIDDGGWRASRD